MNKLLLLDGNSLTYRAFFALPQDMATASGQLTNAVFGFTSMFIYVMKEQRPDQVLVAFDRPEPTFRHEADPTYKAQREAAPDPLRQQMGLVRQVLDALGVAVCELAGFEADDLIATAAEQAAARGDEVVIVTGDRDAYQLVRDPHIKVLYNRRGVSDYSLYDEAGIFERTGVTPAQYPEYAALRGDPSDNLPGVPGVGEKTAAKLIATYGGLDGIFSHLDELTPKLRTSLAESEARVRKNLEVSVLRTGRPGGAPRRSRDPPQPGRGQAALRLPRVPHVRGPPGRGPRPGGGRRGVGRSQRAASRADASASRPSSLVAALVGLGAGVARRGLRGRAGPLAGRRPRRSSPRRSGSGSADESCGSRPLTSPTSRSRPPSARCGSAATTPSR